MSKSIDDFLRDFSQPNPHFSPVPLWWWSGEKLEIGRLRWQMDQLLSMAIRNVVIINLAPNGTMFGSDADDPPFLSEEWWTIFAQVCDHARSIGMSIWFYDQIGFSGASYQAEIAAAHPECLAQQLRRTVVEGTGNLRVECPIAGTPIAAYWLPLSSPLDVRYVTVEGKHASIHSDKPARLCLVYSLSQGYDLFSGSACERLLDAVHRQFERRLGQHLGSTIVGSFQDELPDLPTWGKTFGETFREKYGYELASVIHRLFEEGDADSRRTRLHYHAHRADLAEAAFFKPFYNWHHERGLQCGFDQQSPAREARVLASVTKYADYTRTHRWYAIPGSDLHGNGKLHSSIAFMNNHRRVWLEGFHSTGWGGTIADTFDWLLPYLQAGANLYNPHAVYYSTRKGWWEWAPPSTCWRQPYARHYHVFADMIARLTRILSWGIQQATVAVLFPTATVQSAVGPQEHFADAAAADQTLHEVIGSMRWHQAKLGPLDEMGIGFHLLDEPAIQNSDLRDGNLLVRDVPLSTIILPRVTMLHDATVDSLKAFAAGGGKIIAIGSEEIETIGRKRISIRSLPNAIVIDSAASLAAALKDVRQAVRSPVPVLHRRDGDVNVLLVPAVAGMATVVKWPSWFAPIEHSTIVPERYRDSVEILLAGNIGQIRRFDPRDGSSSSVSTKLESGRTHISLDFEGSPFAVLVWEEGADPHPSPLPEYRAREIALSDAWTCEYLPTLPTEYPDIYDPAQPELRWPHTTDFQWRHNGKEEIVRATFGIRAWSDRAISYSPKFGILQDRMHINTLGPKGHVPEEFIELGKLKKSEPVTIRTGVVSAEHREAILIVGANAHKSATVNRQSLGKSGPEYFWTTPIKLNIGENPIELTLIAERDETVRLFWCLADPQRIEEFMRPERIGTLQSVPAGTTVSYLHRFKTNEPVVDGKIKISIAAIANVYLDGKLLGRQGGFDPYRPMMRGQVYSLPRLEPRKHELRVEIIQPDRPAPLMVDGHGKFALMSDARWTFRCESGDEQPVFIYSRQESDAAAWFLQRRPHPLPETGWLEERSSAGAVLDLPLIPPSPEAADQSLSWIIPPGAKSMRIPLAFCDSAKCFVDDLKFPISDDGAVDLSSGNPTASRRAVLQIISRQLGGGLLLGPVTYQFAQGSIRTGSWLQQGLRSYSGAMRMRQNFIFSPEKRGRTILDLGRVRGTVEATINGRTVGIRCLGPYRFDLTDYLRDGENELELIVTNTLANFLSTWSPTSWWSPDQLDAGIFGPVKISHRWGTDEHR